MSTRNERVQEIVQQAKESSGPRFKEFMEHRTFERMGQTDEPLRTPAEEALVIRQHEWLAANGERVEVTKPGCRTRYDWTPESIAAMVKATKAGKL